MAGTTGLEPAASAVTGQRSNQLNYVPAVGKTSSTKVKCGTRMVGTVGFEPTAFRV